MPAWMLAGRSPVADSCTMRAEGAARRVGEADRSAALAREHAVPRQRQVPEAALSVTAEFPTAHCARLDRLRAHG